MSAEPERMSEAERMEIIMQLAKCVRGPIIGPDIPNREARESYVLRVARDYWNAFGELDRMYIFRATFPTPALLTVLAILPAELAHHAPELGRTFAKGFKATQLYQVSEAWYVKSPTRDLDTPPSQHPDRIECLWMVSEDPTRKPVMKISIADITRDAAGKGTAGGWQDWMNEGAGDVLGRLTYLLPPEAYLTAGQPVPRG